MSETKNGWKPPPSDAARFDRELDPKPPPDPDPDIPPVPKQTYFRQYSNITVGLFKSKFNDVYNPATDVPSYVIKLPSPWSYSRDHTHPLYYRRSRTFKVRAKVSSKSGTTWKTLPDDDGHGKPIFMQSHDVFRRLCNAKGWEYKNLWQEKLAGSPTPLYEVTDWKFVQGRYKKKQKMDDDGGDDGNKDARLDELESDFSFDPADIDWGSILSGGLAGLLVQAAVELIVQPLAEEAFKKFLDLLGPVGDLLKMGLSGEDDEEEGEDPDSDQEAEDRKRAKDNFQKHAPLYFDPEKTGDSAILQYTAFGVLKGQDFAMFPSLFDKSRGTLTAVWPKKWVLACASVTVYNEKFDDDEVRGMEDAGYLTFTQAWYCRLSPMALQFGVDIDPEVIETVRGGLNALGITGLDKALTIAKAFLTLVSKPEALLTH